MKEIFDNYMMSGFGGVRDQSFSKIEQFKFNYLKYFPKNVNANVLDIGIGRGEMLSCMKDWGYKSSLGIDISASTVEFCQSLGLPCELVDDTADWLKGHKNEFDVITLLDVLEHIKKEDTIYFLSVIRESLKKGGILIIQTPNLQSPDGQLHRYNDFTHEFGYVEHSLTQVLVAAKFKNIKFFGFELIIQDNPLSILKKIIRLFYRQFIYYTRRINGNLNPSIIDPVFYCVARKD